MRWKSCSSPSFSFPPPFPSPVPRAESPCTATWREHLKLQEKNPSFCLKNWENDPWTETVRGSPHYFFLSLRGVPCRQYGHAGCSDIARTCLFLAEVQEKGPLGARGWKGMGGGVGILGRREQGRDAPPPPCLHCLGPGSPRTCTCRADPEQHGGGFQDCTVTELTRAASSALKGARGGQTRRRQQRF